MSRSSRHKTKDGSSSELSRDVLGDGTSARTRPYSFDEVMLRRNNKRETTGTNIVTEETDNLARGHDIEDESEAVELNGNRHNDLVPSRMEQVLEDSRRECFRKMENASVKEEKLMRKHDEGSRKSEINRNVLKSKIVSGVDTMKHKSDRHDHVGRKRDEFSSDYPKKEQAKRHSEDFVRNEKSAEKSRGRYEKGRKSSQRAGYNDQQFDNKRKNDDQWINDSDNRSKKRISKDLIREDTVADRSRLKAGKETNRKDHIEDNEKVKEKHESKKHDPGNKVSSDFNERKEKESSKIHHEKPKSKRRRSRSIERDRDRVRRSSSPKVQKHTSNNVREYQDSVTYSSRDRSGVLHCDTDRRRMSSNGSGGQYRRHNGSSSGLGGYSPRKRKSETAARTPSPVRRSPEKRTPGWDLPPARPGSSGGGGLVSGQNTSLNKQELPSVIPVTPIMENPIGISYNFAQLKVNTADSVQLTQATRPMRRLYVENLPASASEKAFMEWINFSLLSSGVNHIQGTQPCFSCLLNKEKGEALLEFLTPEDASAAISFDGRSFSGSVLKFRRPKDFIDVATGIPEKSVDSADTICDFVEDSPNKIFIGGISNRVSSEMLMEVARSFGPLKAYHVEVDEDIKESCAFLEYDDHSVTLKACAGLNGMKLGGQMLTVVQAIRDDSRVVNGDERPFYGIPEHAKPLLQKPSHVLKLRNVFDPEGLPLLSEAEVDDILEDIRTECSRFGMVKSVNFVKQSSIPTTTETFDVVDNSAVAGDSSRIAESISNIDELGKGGKLEPPSSGKELEKVSKASEVYTETRSGIPDPPNFFVEPESKSIAVCDSHALNLLKDEMCDINQDDRHAEVKEPTCQDISCAVSGGFLNQNNEKTSEIAKTRVEDLQMGKMPSIEEDLRSEEKTGKLDSAFPSNAKREKDSDAPEKVEVIENGEDIDRVCNIGEIFEPGSVLVEFKREEASCMAAHCLHGRLFDNRIVTVGYVDLDVYRIRFLK